MARVKYSVVIRCCNEQRHIERLIKGIQQQTVWEDTEIIVVDSGSTDSTLEILSRYPVRILQISPEEFSFGRSLNTGCREAKGEFIVIASAHVYPVYSQWIEHLTAPFQDHRIALVYGKQRGDESTKYSEHQVFAKWFPEESSPDQNQPFCNNANAAIRRSLWAEFQYDETLTGLEDIEWAKRVLAAAHKIAYAADAEVIHVHEETPERIFNRYRREAIALKRVFPQERFVFHDFLRLFLSNSVNDMKHALHDGVLIANIHMIFIFRLMQFWGTYRGFDQVKSVTSQLKQTFYYPRDAARKRSSAEPQKGMSKIQYPASSSKEKL
jgi:glycosyltransferase involved in cell wall biosynthesis